MNNYFMCAICSHVFLSDVTTIKLDIEMLWMNDYKNPHRNKKIKDLCNKWLL